MNRFFRNLSLPAKLSLIGLLPLIFLLFLSFKLYNEHTQKLKLLGNYIDRIHQSADITNLIDNLQAERKYSFQYALKKEMYRELLGQRPKTDSIINRLSAYKETLSDFYSYTFLKNLADVRKAIDSGYANTTFVMDYYTNVLFRFNTLNALPTGSNVYLEPVYKDLVAQKLLSEMVTYLGIMSANVYNALYTHQYMTEILMGTRGTYNFYNSYEDELLLKAPPAVAQSYKKMESSSPLKPVNAYLDKLFKSFSFDSTFEYAGWAATSSAAVDELRALQQSILKNALDRVNTIFSEKQKERKNTFIFLIFIFVFVVTIIFFAIRTITRMLTELKQATEKISKGETGFQLNINSSDAIGNLAQSIAVIDETNRHLAHAAVAIGNGDFSVYVRPRSENDLLGNAIIQMKNNLQQLIGDLKKAQNEIDDLNKDLEKKIGERTDQLQKVNGELEAFSYSVSHDLRAPLRGIIGFAAVLEEDYGDKLDDEAKRVISVIRNNTIRMGRLIDDLLTFSRMGRQDISKSKFRTNAMIKDVITELTNENNNPGIKWIIQDVPDSKADINAIRQVWINLLSNAIKYSRNSGYPSIEIGAYKNNDETVFFIKDNGVGFDERYKDKLFKVFQRLHKDADFEGTGIGLAIVEKIVSKHGGKVWAEGAVGKGATFYFTLPE